MPENPATVGYVVKRYPRYSETFIVSEILAHEAAGQPVEIFALRPPCDTHFQDAIARVRAPVTYIPNDGQKAQDLWSLLQQAGPAGVASMLSSAAGENAHDVCQAAWLAREVRQRGIGHLHAHFATLPTTVARLAARLAGIGYTFTAHAKDIYAETVSHQDLRRKITDAAGVATVSDYNLGYLRRTFGPAAERVMRLYNGLDLSTFTYEEPRARPPVVLSVGRLVPKKGIPYLVDACERLRDRGVRFECRIIGAGPDEREIAARVTRARLGDRVRLLGPRPGAAVIDEMRQAGVFAAPCVVSPDGDRDGLPTVLLEAMALGTPCVATDVTGIPEAVKAGETGLLVGQRDAAGLAEALEQLLGDAEARVRLATRARRHIERHFDGAANALRLRGLFAAAVASREAAAEFG